MQKMLNEVIMKKWIKNLLALDYDENCWAYKGWSRLRLIKYRLGVELRYGWWLMRSYFCKHDYEEKTFVYVCSKCKRFKNK